MKLFNKLLLLILLSAPAWATVPKDSLPAGTKISLSILLPGESTPNRINYTVPDPIYSAPSVVIPPVVVTPPVVVRDPKLLFDGQVIGTRQGHNLIVRSVNGKLFLSEDVGSGNFLFRGANLLKRSDVQTAFGALASQLSGGSTAFDGLTEPAGVSAPTGYVQRKFSDGAVYYGPSDSSPPAVSVPDKSTSQTTPTGPLVGVGLLKAYTLEGKQEWKPEQFGLNDYYSPNFWFSLDWNPGNRTVAERKALGINLFNAWATGNDEKASMADGSAMRYLTESGLTADMEGPGFFETPLPQFEQKIWNKIPACGYGADAGVRLVALNLEQSNDWNRGNYNGEGHWPTWESSKNRTVFCEWDGQYRTLQQIDDQGLWGVAAAVHRGNRRTTIFEALRLKAAYPIKISDGSSPYQGMPRLDFAERNNPFLNSSANVSNIVGSDGIKGFDGTITLNGRKYTRIKGSQYDQEDVTWGYYYLFGWNIPNVVEYQQIFSRTPNAKTNFPAFWAALEPYHIVADEKGYRQENQRLQRLNQGKTRPIVRMIEPSYEGTGYAGGWDNNKTDWIPWDDLQKAVTGNDQPPKPWQPPYYNYARYAVSRIMAGDEPGNGLHMFPVDPSHIAKELIMPYYNFHFHTVSALMQARKDMQPFETFYPGSTLVEDPEVKINGTGEFLTYNGTDAMAYSDGTYRQQKPAVILRWKKTDSGSYQVLIVAGMNQGYAESTRPVVRIPNGGANGNVFELPLTGPGAHIFYFETSPADQNKAYTGVSISAPAGYSGLISNN